MSIRAMWTGSISFGLVSFPVRLFKATAENGLAFTLICPEHGTQVGNKRYCKLHDHDVEWASAVRAYSPDKETFVPITDAELDELPIPTVQRIEILEFVDAREISHIYAKQVYFIEPMREKNANGEIPYALLRGVMQQAGLVAVGKFARRERERLARLAPVGDSIELTELFWPDEIRSSAGLEFPNYKSTKQELQMAMTLVKQMSTRFDPSRYKDTYHDAVDALVTAKLTNKPAPKARKAPTPPSDLMAALKASLEAQQKTA